MLLYLQAELRYSANPPSAAGCWALCGAPPGTSLWPPLAGRETPERQLCGSTPAGKVGRFEINFFPSDSSNRSKTRELSPCPSRAWSWWSERRPGERSHSCPFWRRQQSGCWTAHGLMDPEPRPRCSNGQLHRCFPHSAPCCPGLSMLTPRIHTFTKC